MTDKSRSAENVILGGFDAVAICVDADFVVREVHGTAFQIPGGLDVRESLPVLYGMEESLAKDEPDLAFPFVEFGDEFSPRPIALSARRDPHTKKLWVLVRDAAEEATLRQALIQQHNTLALAQRDLIDARDQALAADRVKATFLANVSHELRTPLHIVIGGASILEQAAKDELPATEITQFATDIRESGAFLLELVNDLIDLSRSETGDLNLHDEWCDLSRLAHEVLRLSEAHPDRGPIKLSVTAQNGLPRFLVDPTRIKQILFNLVSNAIRAIEDEGEIVVSISRASTGGAIISVSDNGPGMSSEDLAVALEPFGRVDPKHSIGSGLGLAIVERLAKLHDGSLSVTSTPGEGVRATVTIGSNRADPTIETQIES